MKDYTPLDQPSDNFVTVDGVRICYHRVGSKSAADIPIIFTHGGGPGSSSWNNFLYNARAFANRYDCIFFDLPGYGGSDFCPVQGPTFSWFADKLAKFMDQLNIEQAHFVNQSFGGAVAIKLAAIAPSRVGKLVISGARPVIGGIWGPVVSTRARRAVETYYGGEGPSAQKMRELISDLEFFDATMITDLNVQLRHATSIKPAVVKLLSDPTLRGTPESLFELFRDVRSKTLIVQGLHDAFTSLDVPLVMLNQFQNARLHVLGKAAHHVQTECHHEYNDLVLNFLS